MTEYQDILTVISSYGVHTKETSLVATVDTIWSPDDASRSEAILGRGSSHTAVEKSALEDQADVRSTKHDTGLS